MNMKKMFLAAVSMFGYGQSFLPSEKGSFKKAKQKTAKSHSINGRMKMYRDRSHGTMSRLIARNKVKGRYIFA